MTAMADRTIFSTFLADATETDAFAAELADILSAGDCVLLSGELGAGKSHLARAVIQTLQSRFGQPEDVPSPTYTIVQTYAAGDLSILHADLYRIADASELDELGIEEAFETSLCLIEWPDRIEAFPPGALDVHLSSEGDGRRVRLRGDAAVWTPRLTALGSDLA